MVLASEEQAGSVGAVLRRMLGYAFARGERGTWWRLGLSLSALALAKTGAVCLPLVYGALVDQLAVEPFAVQAFIGLLGLYALARLGHELATEVNQLVFAQVAQRAVSRLSHDAFRRFNERSLDFHLNRRTGDLAKATDRGGRGLDQLLSLTMYEILPVALELALASGVLWAGFGLGYALLTLGTVLAYTVFTIVCTEWRVRFRTQLNVAEEAAMGYAVDSLLNYETIKCCTAEGQTQQRYRGLLETRQAAREAHDRQFRAQTHQARLAAADARHFHRLFLVDHAGQRAAALPLQLLGVGAQLGRLLVERLEVPCAAVLERRRDADVVRAVVLGALRDELDGEHEHRDRPDQRPGDARELAEPRGAIERRGLVAVGGIPATLAEQRSTNAFYFSGGDAGALAAFMVHEARRGDRRVALAYGREVDSFEVAARDYGAEVGRSLGLEVDLVPFSVLDTDFTPLLDAVTASGADSRINCNACTPSASGSFRSIRATSKPSSAT